MKNRNQNKSRHNTELYVCGMPANSTKFEMREYFKKFGAIKSVRIKNRSSDRNSTSYCIIEFYHTKGLNSVLSHPNHFVNGRVVECRPHLKGRALQKALQEFDRKRVFVSNIDKRASDNLLCRLILQKTGLAVKTCYIVENNNPKKRTNIGYLTLHSEEEANFLLNSPRIYAYQKQLVFRAYKRRKELKEEEEDLGRDFNFYQDDQVKSNYNYSDYRRGSPLLTKPFEGVESSFLQDQVHPNLDEGPPQNQKAGYSYPSRDQRAPQQAQQHQDYSRNQHFIHQEMEDQINQNVNQNIQSRGGSSHNYQIHQQSENNRLPPIPENEHDFQDQRPTSAIYFRSRFWQKRDSFSHDNYNLRYNAQVEADSIFLDQRVGISKRPPIRRRGRAGARNRPLLSRHLPQHSEIKLSK